MNVTVFNEKFIAIGGLSTEVDFDTSTIYEITNGKIDLNYIDKLMSSLEE